MDFRVLGPIDLVDDAGSSVRLASEGQRRLVALLAAHAGQVVRSEMLEDALQLSAGALRTSVSRLRRIVGFDVLVTAAPGYELRTDRIDALRFERLLAQAASGDGPGQMAALRAALASWRGEAYAEFAHEPWAAAEATRLEELRVGAVEDLAALEIGAGERAPAIARLEALIAAHPYADRPRALLMEALARSGRQAEALRAFADYRHLLAAEVGTEPGPELVALDRRVAMGVATTTARPLPARMTRLVGRDADLATVTSLVEGHRLVTLTGTGGCGKTSLALEAGRSLDSEGSRPVLWVDLAGTGTPHEVIDLLAVGCGVAPAPGTDQLEALVHRLGQLGPALLVVDNAEHVAEATAAAVVSLLSSCPELRVLVTSREPLGVPGAAIWRVPSLSTPPAAARTEQELEASGAGALLLERVRAARATLDLDGDTVAALASICRQVDGLPLALELAAGRLRALSPGRVAEELRASHASLEARGGTGSERHRTMRASIAWSLALLEEHERVALRRLAVFVAPFDEDDAVAVAADGEQLDPSAALDALARLVDANLVALDDATGRYRLSAATREFCRETHAPGDEDDATAARHARWMADWCLEVGAGNRGIDRRPFLDRMPEVVAATAWARAHDPGCAFDICRGLASMRSLLGHRDDLEQTWDWLMRFDRDGPSGADWAGAVAALMAAATGAGWDVSGLAPELADRLAPDDVAGRRWLARGRAMVPAYRGDVGPALDYAQAVVASGNDLELSIYAGFAAYMAAMCGLLADAEHLIDELRQMVHRHDAPFFVDTVGNGHAAAVLVAVARGDLGALAALSEGPTPTDPTFSVTASSALAHGAVLLGDHDLLARALAWEPAETITLLRFLPPLNRFHHALATGDLEQASLLAEQYRADAEQVPVSRLHPRVLMNVALLETGRLGAVERAIDEGERLLAAMPAAPYLQVQLQLSRAQLAVAHGDGTTARREAGRAHAVAAQQRFDLAAIDAAELVAVAAHLDGASGDEVADLLAEPTARRTECGYRAVMVAPHARYDDALEAAALATEPA